MKEAIKKAADLDLVCSVEVVNRFEQFLLNTAEEAVSYVTEVGSLRLKILLDTYHMNIEEDSVTGRSLPREPFSGTCTLERTTPNRRAGDIFPGRRSGRR